MYSYIIGVVTHKEEGKIALENNGIGYEINVSTSTLSALPLGGDVVRIFTYLVVREDEMSLYGFISNEEKNMFLLLTTVSGIGPKMALGILSEITIPNLMAAIASEDLRTLTKVKGLGKKTAERLILELKDKVNPLEALSMGGSMAVEMPIDEQIFEDAVVTLTSLGISKNEAGRLVKQAYKPNMSIEDLISAVLRGMSR